MSNGTSKVRRGTIVKIQMLVAVKKVKRRNKIFHVLISAYYTLSRDNKQKIYVARILLYVYETREKRIFYCLVLLSVSLLVA